jgi:hypothetical protein
MLGLHKLEFAVTHVPQFGVWSGRLTSHRKKIAIDFQSKLFETVWIYSIIRPILLKIKT